MTKTDFDRDIARSKWRRRFGLLRNRRNKVFCVGMQRSGTTSLGDFCEKSLGMVRRPNALSRQLGWSRHWLEGRMDLVYAHPMFISGEMFDDGPWWFPGVYRDLAETFPRARFVMFNRDSAAWFRSLMAHSRGRSPGFTAVHARIYEREDDLTPEVKRQPRHVRGFALAGHEAHYRAIYERHIAAVQAYFAENGPHRLFYCDLNDPDKFRKLAVYLGHPNKLYPNEWSNAIASTPVRQNNAVDRGH